MKLNITKRAMGREDFAAIERILDRVELFPSQMLAAMAEPYLAGSAADHWIVAIASGRVCGFAFAEPERMTEGTFNLLAIAVDPDLQRRGIGVAIVAALETRLSGNGARILLVETSSLDSYVGTRSFYSHQAFVEEARIRDFYTPGEDKIVFWKQL